MDNLRLLFSIIALLAATSVMTEKYPDSQGTEFLFAFGSNHNNRGGALHIYITTGERSTVDFNITFGNTSMDGSVKAGESNTYNIPDYYRMSDDRSCIEKKAVIIQSSGSIVVYASNEQKTSIDSFMVLPTDVLGTEYVVPAWPTTNNVSSGSMIVVAAGEDNTTLRITLQGIEVIPSFSLNRGEVFQFLAVESSVKFNISEDQYIDDVTGSLIQSDKPVAVLSGNKRTDVHMNHTIRLSSDHLVEMIPPISSLGREFFTQTTIERKGDIYRIIGAGNSTNVTIYRSSDHSNTTRTLNLIGGFITLESEENEVMHITTSGPAIVTQYTQSEYGTHNESDPMMSLVTPREQYRNQYIITTPRPNTGTGNKTFRNYLNIIINSTETGGLRLDGNSITQTFNGSSCKSDDDSSITANCWVQSNWESIGSTGYSARTLSIVHGTHRIYHMDPTVVFHAMIYGMRSYQSYGFPAGMRLAPIGDFCTPSNGLSKDGLDNDCDDRIDEELLNSIDDDGDGLIDEDVAELPATTKYISSTKSSDIQTSTLPITTDRSFHRSTTQTQTTSFSTEHFYSTVEAESTRFASPISSSTTQSNQPISTATQPSATAQHNTSTYNTTVSQPDLTTTTTVSDNKPTYNTTKQPSMSPVTSRPLTNTSKLAGNERESEEKTDNALQIALPLVCVLLILLIAGLVIRALYLAKKHPRVRPAPRVKYNAGRESLTVN